jgi:hypothetical protein
MDGKTFQTIRIDALKVSIETLAQLLHGLTSETEIREFEKEVLKIPASVISKLIEITNQLNSARKELKMGILTSFKNGDAKSKYLISYLSDDDFQKFGGETAKAFYENADLYNQVLYAVRLHLTSGNYTSVAILPLYPHEYVQWLEENHKESSALVQQEWAGIFWKERLVPYFFTPLRFGYDSNSSDADSLFNIKDITLPDSKEIYALMEKLSSEHLEIEEKFGISFNEPFHNNLLAVFYQEFCKNPC